MKYLLLLLILFVLAYLYCQKPKEKYCGCAA